MAAQILDGKLMSESLRKEIAARVEKLKARGVTLLTGCRAVRIDARGVWCRTPDGARLLPADTVVAAIGDAPEDGLYRSVADDFGEVYLIGDANGGGVIPNAVYEGYQVGCRL